MKKLPKKVQKLLKDKNLELVKIMQEPNAPRSRFYSLKTKRKGEDSYFLLKIFGQGNPDVVTAFYKEVGFFELVTERSDLDLGGYVPRFVDRGDGEQPWYLRTFAPGSFFGDICYDFGVREEFLIDETAKEFINFFAALGDFTKAVSENSYVFTLSTHGLDWYEGDWDYYRQRSQTVSAESFHRLHRLLKKYRPLLNESANSLVHGDLYLKNILWASETGLRGQGESPLSVIDWEVLHFGNKCFDPVFIWLLAWKNSDWRKKFKSMVFAGVSGSDREDLLNLWNLASCSLSLRFIRHCELMLEIFSQDKKKERQNAEQALAEFHKSLDRSLASL